MSVLSRASYLAVALLAIAGCAVNPLPIATDNEPLWAHDESDIKPDPAVRYGVLANGMRYAILVNDTPSGVAAARLQMDVGSVHEDDHQQGLAHFLEHMAFNGSQNVPEGEMVKILERHGLAFGPDTNAATGFQTTTYMLDLPALDEETLDSAFFLLRETADKLLLADDAIDRERGVVLSEERISNTFGLRAAKAELAFALPHARATSRFPIGQVSVLEEADRTAFADLYDKYYRPERAFLVIVGDIDADAMETRIAETFADWAGRGEAGADPDPGSIEPRALEAAFFHDPDIPTQVSFSWLSPYEEEPDTAEVRARRLLVGLGLSAINRRLTRIARSEDAPFLGAGVSLSDFEEAADIASLNVTAEPDSWPSALAAAEQELRAALEHGFTEAEIAEQVAEMRDALTRRADQADTRTTTSLARGLLSAHAGERVFTDPRDDLERVTPTLDAATPDAVIAALREDWVDGEPLIFMTSNRELDAPEEALLAAYRDSRQVAVAPPDQAESLAFAYADWGPAGEVVSREVIDDLDITTVRFANNVRLNVKQTDFREARANLRVRVGRGGLEFPKDQPGLDVFVDSVMVRGGLEAHSADDVQSLTAGTSASPSFSVANDAFVIGATVEPDDLILQLQLAAATLVHPGFRPEAQSFWARVVPTWYETLDATPQAVRGREVSRILASGDPRFGIPSETELERRTLSEAEAGIARARADGAIEIGVVGDIDVEAVIDAVARTFGALPERRAELASFEEARDITFPDGAAEPITLRHAGEPDRALALTHWRARDDADADEARRLRLLARILSRRLVEEVREELSATYSPSASVSLSRVFPGYGYFVASLDLEPERVPELFAIMDAIAADLAAGTITEDELERARRPLLEDLEERLENNRYWLSLVDTAQTEPERLDRHREDQAAYERITLAELHAAAAAYLTPETALRVQILPEDEG